MSIESDGWRYHGNTLDWQYLGLAQRTGKKFPWRFGLKIWLVFG
jgi:hypothetical protein